MTIEVPAEAYVSFAKGEISEDELLELEKFASMLGNVRPVHLAGLAAAVPTLGYIGAKVPQMIEDTADAMTFNRDLKRILEVHPQLGSTEDPNLRMAFKTLRSVNPEYSKDPLIAGTILDMVMRGRIDPDDPSSAPRFDPALLQSIQGRGDSARSLAMAQGAGATSSSLRKILEEMG